MLCGWMFLFPKLVESCLFQKNVAGDFLDRHVANGFVYHSSITSRAALGVERCLCISQFVGFFVDLPNGLGQTTCNLLVKNALVAYLLRVLTRHQQFAIFECLLARLFETDGIQRSESHNPFATGAALGPTKQPAAGAVGRDLEPEISP